MRTRDIIALLLAVFVLLPASLSAQFNWPYTIQNGTIVTEVPQRPAGQRSALGLAVEKIPVVRVAFVGLGMRGPDAVERWTHIPGIEVKALCDHERDRAEACQEILKTASGVIHYWTSESDPGKQTLVFLPGLTADHHLFDKQIEAFEKEFDLLTWDAPGHAASRPFRLDFSLMDKAVWRLRASFPLIPPL